MKSVRQKRIKNTFLGVRQLKCKYFHTAQKSNNLHINKSVFFKIPRVSLFYGFRCIDVYVKCERQIHLWLCLLFFPSMLSSNRKIQKKNLSIHSKWKQHHITAHTAEGQTAEINVWNKGTGGIRDREDGEWELSLIDTNMITQTWFKLSF